MIDALNAPPPSEVFSENPQPAATPQMQEPPALHVYPDEDRRMDDNSHLSPPPPTETPLREITQRSSVVQDLAQSNFNPHNIPDKIEEYYKLGGKVEDLVNDPALGDKPQVKEAVEKFQQDVAQKQQLQSELSTALQSSEPQKTEVDRIVRSYFDIAGDFTDFDQDPTVQENPVFQEVKNRILTEKKFAYRQELIQIAHEASQNINGTGHFKSDMQHASTQFTREWIEIGKGLGQDPAKLLGQAAEWGFFSPEQLAEISNPEQSALVSDETPSVDIDITPDLLEQIGVKDPEGNIKKGKLLLYSMLALALLTADTGFAKLSKSQPIIPMFLSFAGNISSEFQQHEYMMQVKSTDPGLYQKYMQAGYGPNWIIGLLMNEYKKREAAQNPEDQITPPNAGSPTT